MALFLAVSRAANRGGPMASVVEPRTKMVIFEPGHAFLDLACSLDSCLEADAFAP